MDPDAALREALAALVELEGNTNDGDARTRAVEHLRALADWIERGGFPPRKATQRKEVD